MSNKSEAVSTIFAVLRAIDRNDAISTMISDYLISSSEEKEHFRVEAKTFIDKCKLEIDQLKKQFRSKTFSSFDQLNKLLADLLYQNHDLRQKVLDIKADIVYTESNRGATGSRATCPVDVIYGDFPDLLKKQQTGSLPLTALCDVLMDSYNLYSDPWVSKALSKLEIALGTKLENKGGRSAQDNPVSNTGPFQDKEKTPSRKITTSVTAGVTRTDNPVSNTGPFQDKEKTPSRQITTSVTAGVTRTDNPVSNTGPFQDKEKTPSRQITTSVTAGVTRTDNPVPNTGPFQDKEKTPSRQITTSVTAGVARTDNPVSNTGPFQDKEKTPSRQITTSVTAGVTRTDNPVSNTGPFQDKEKTPSRQITTSVTAGVTRTDNPVSNTGPFLDKEKTPSRKITTSVPAGVPRTDNPVSNTGPFQDKEKTPSRKITTSVTEGVTRTDNPVPNTGPFQDKEKTPSWKITTSVTAGVTRADNPVSNTGPFLDKEKTPSRKITTSVPAEETRTDNLVSNTGPFQDKEKTPSRKITASVTAGVTRTDNPVSNTGPFQDKEKTPSRKITDSVTAGVTRTALESTKGAPVNNMVAEPIASMSPDYKVTVVKETGNPKLTTSVTADESRRLKPIEQPGDPLLAALPVIPVVRKVKAAKEKSRRLKRITPPCDQVMVPLTVTTVDKPIIPANESMRLKHITPPSAEVSTPLTVTPVDRKVIAAKGTSELKPDTLVAAGMITESETAGKGTLTESMSITQTLNLADSKVSVAKETSKLKHVTLGVTGEPNALINATQAVDLVAASLTISPAQVKVPGLEEDRRLTPTTSVSVVATTGSKTSTKVTSNNTPAIDRISAPVTISPAKFKVPVVEETRRPTPTTSVSVVATTGSETRTKVTSNDTQAVDWVSAPFTISPAMFKVPVVDENRRLPPTTSVSVVVTTGSKSSTKVTRTDTPAVDRMSAPVTISPAKLKVPVVEENRRLTPTTSVSVVATTGSKTSTKVTLKDTPAIDRISTPVTICPAKFKVPVVKENRRLTPTTSVSVLATTGSKTSTKVTSTDTPAIDRISAPVTISLAKFKVPVVKENRRLTPTEVTSKDTPVVDVLPAPLKMSPAELKVPVVKKKRRLTSTNSVSEGATTGSKTSTKVISKVTPAGNQVSVQHTIPPANRTVVAPKEGRKMKSKASTTLRDKMSIQPCNPVSVPQTTPLTDKTVRMAKESLELKPTTSLTTRPSMCVQAGKPNSSPLSNTPANRTVLLTKESGQLKPMTSVNPRTDTRVVVLDSRNMLGETVEVTTVNLPVYKKPTETVRQVTFDTSPRKVILNEVITTLPVGHPISSSGSTVTAASHPVISAVDARLETSEAMRADLSSKASNLVTAPLTRILADHTVSVTKKAKTLEPVTSVARRVKVSVHGLDSLWDNSDILKEIKQVYSPPMTFDPLPLKVIMSKFTTTLPQGYLCTLRESMKKRQGAYLEQLPAQCNIQRVGQPTGKTRTPSRPNSPDIPPVDQRLTNICTVSVNTSPQTSGRLAGRKRRAKGWEFSSVPPAKRRRLSIRSPVQSPPRPRGIAGRKRSAESLDGLSVPPAKRRKIVPPPSGQWTFECGGWTYRKRSC